MLHLSLLEEGFDLEHRGRLHRNLCLRPLGFGNGDEVTKSRKWLLSGSPPDIITQIYTSRYNDSESQHLKRIVLKRTPSELSTHCLRSVARTVPGGDAPEAEAQRGGKVEVPTPDTSFSLPERLGGVVLGAFTTLSCSGGRGRTRSCWLEGPWLRHRLGDVANSFMRARPSERRGMFAPRATARAIFRPTQRKQLNKQGLWRVSVGHNDRTSVCRTDARTVKLRMVGISSYAPASSFSNRHDSAG